MFVSIFRLQPLRWNRTSALPCSTLFRTCYFLCPNRSCIMKLRVHHAYHQSSFCSLDTIVQAESPVVSIFLWLFWRGELMGPYRPHRSRSSSTGIGFTLCLVSEPILLFFMPRPVRGHPLNEWIPTALSAFHGAGQTTVRCTSTS